MSVEPQPAPVSIVIEKVEASPFVKVIVFPVAEAELIKLPVSVEPPLADGRVTVLPFNIESS